LRPVIAITRATIGPLTSGPEPCRQLASVAFSAMPSIRRLVPISALLPA
jgi:hypothetical protein